MTETQVLMTVSDFSGFFLGMISWKGASLFNGGGSFSDGEGFIFMLGGKGWCPTGGISFGRGFQKIL